jgi:hypothetical protein
VHFKSIAEAYKYRNSVNSIKNRQYGIARLDSSYLDELTSKVASETPIL